MAVLANIEVTLATLKTVRPDIALRFEYRDEEGENFADEITRAKSTLYRQVLDHERIAYPGYTETQLATRLEDVKDIPDANYLLDRLNNLTISEIMKANDFLEQAEVYAKDAYDIDLIYWVDTDDDGVIDSNEARDVPRARFGR